MSKLNLRTEKTEKIIHLMVTSLCQRNCKYCCNKQYDLNNVPYVSHEELEKADTLCITGGEPFLFSNPSQIAQYYKTRYSNIKNVYVYTNAFELGIYLLNKNPLDYIDGLNISIKTKEDAKVFENYIKTNQQVLELKSNRLYVFDDLYNGPCIGFMKIARFWQSDFVPANDSIFRKI